ncbi:MAG TPA: glycosyl transferase [Cytophagales bacterium]|nr:glycosyl transferase [Cytophagales bacterium]
MKRFFDLVTAGLGLIFLTPLFLIIAILIKSNSKGPVFYKQPRVGKGGVLFNLFKFRTMQVGADRATAITVGHRDPRITPIGYYLRKFKLDELPQLINVLVGEMSLVGPRPELEKFVKLYNERQRKVISVKPGITDYASIQFRNENEMLAGKPDPVDYYIKEIMPLKLELNLQYIANQSFLTDLKIIGQTIFLVFFKK